MKYIVMLSIFFPVYYAYSYIKYCWKQKNRMAALGTILLCLLSIAFPVMLLFFKR